MTVYPVNQSQPQYSMQNIAFRIFKILPKNFRSFGPRHLVCYHYNMHLAKSFYNICASYMSIAIVVRHFICDFTGRRILCLQFLKIQAILHKKIAQKTNKKKKKKKYAENLSIFDYNKHTKKILEELRNDNRNQPVWYWAKNASKK